MLGKLGGKSWWTALAGRVKVQRMLRLARQATGGKRKARDWFPCYWGVGSVAYCLFDRLDS